MRWVYRSPETGGMHAPYILDDSDELTDQQVMRIAKELENGGGLP